MDLVGCTGQPVMVSDSAVCPLSLSPSLPSHSSRALCSRSPPLPWSTTHLAWSPTPPSCRAAAAVGSLLSADVACPRPQALKIRWTNRWHQARDRATVGRRNLCGRRARRRRPTASTSGLCGALSPYLTACPSPSLPSRPPCPPSLWPCDRATWRTEPGGLTPARGPGPCLGRSLSYKSLLYWPAMNSLPFTREVWWEGI